MKNILIFGSGRSAWYTISYLAKKHGKSWNLTITDSSPEALGKCREKFPKVNILLSDVLDQTQREGLVAKNDIIISLLPARFHDLLAMDCLHHKKHLLTPSYISAELNSMNEAVTKAGLIFLNELGLDPGIDHMSAMSIIARLKSEGAEIESFKSYCGGLIASESDNNPWHYKISWNPYNIIRSGQDGGICLLDGKNKFLPYNRLFSEAELIVTKNSGNFDAYLNRNSFPYIHLYGLVGIKTFVRGTLRYHGFARLWQFLVNTGITNDKIALEGLLKLSWKDFFASFMPDPEKDISYNFYKIINDYPTEEEIAAISWLGFNNTELLPINSGTPAQLLQILLEQKWKLSTEDKDRVVMIHEFTYSKSGMRFQLQSVLDITGEDEQQTAMARTVGMPLALAADLIAHGKIHAKGVLLPIIPEVYDPLLKGLKESGIIFKETEVEIK